MSNNVAVNGGEAHKAFITPLVQQIKENWEIKEEDKGFFNVGFKMAGRATLNFSLAIVGLVESSVQALFALLTSPEYLFREDPKYFNHFKDSAADALSSTKNAFMGVFGFNGCNSNEKDDNGWTPWIKNKGKEAYNAFCSKVGTKTASGAAALVLGSYFGFSALRNLIIRDPLTYITGWENFHVGDGDSLVYSALNKAGDFFSIASSVGLTGVGCAIGFQAFSYGYKGIGSIWTQLHSTEKK